MGKENPPNCTHMKQWLCKYCRFFTGWEKVSILIRWAVPAQVTVFSSFLLVNSLALLLTREHGALSFSFFRNLFGSTTALKESCSWVVPGWPSVEMRSWSMLQSLSQAGGGTFSVERRVCVAAYRAMDVVSTTEHPLSAGEIPHLSNCSQHSKPNSPAWHTVAAMVTLHDALRACHLGQ